MFSDFFGLLPRSFRRALGRGGAPPRGGPAVRGSHRVESDGCGLRVPDGFTASLGDRAGLAYDPQPLGRPLRARRSRPTTPAAASPSPPNASRSPSAAAKATRSVQAALRPRRLGARAGAKLSTLRAPCGARRGRRAAVPLEYHGRWTSDVEDLARAVDERTRPCSSSAPNNPTGSCSAARAPGLSRSVPSAGLALGDEVFGDYRGGRCRCARSVLEAQALTVSLGGLSKSVGLPQLKLGWMAVDGPDAVVAETMRASR